MAKRLYPDGKPPIGWVSVARELVHPDWPSTSHPAVDYFYNSDKWWVAPKDAPPAKPVDPIRSQVLDEAKGLINGDGGSTTVRRP